MDNKNNIKTLGTERCENIDTVYINKIQTPRRGRWKVPKRIKTNYLYECASNFT